MKTIYICGGGKGNTSVRVLKVHLEGLGHTVVRSNDEPHDVTLGWGMSRQWVKGPMLNANVNQYDKFRAMYKFVQVGVKTAIVFPAGDAELYGGLEHFPFPWLARKVVHQGGKDIKIVNSFQEAQRTPCDFFSVYIPTKTEYRVWTFMGKAFSVYEKIYKGEGEYQGVQRNHAFGFRFEKQDHMLQEKALCDPAVKAVSALGMNFGAVDVILGKDDKYYVLEVNSMPSIDNEKKSNGIRLANLVSKWAESQQ